ncbi:hypothetical protein Tsp_15076 [Trichinella spiralis]|uniref:hypothetical protein n=1 Tax=Trichinella spiralis TaxID=6334 RepID=UPI0001EFE0C4|nr:hypothetical protein Tsp_15076 [Trichinella spiralis]
MLFQECEVLNDVITTMCSGDAQLLLDNQVILIPVVVIRDLKNSASMSYMWSSMEWDISSLVTNKTQGTKLKVNFNTSEAKQTFYLHVVFYHPSKLRDRFQSRKRNSDLGI